MQSAWRPTVYTWSAHAHSGDDQRFKVLKYLYMNHRDQLLLRPAYARFSIRFILPEFVSYLGESGVLCVETVHISVHQSLWACEI